MKQKSDPPCTLISIILLLRDNFLTKWPKMSKVCLGQIKYTPCFPFRMKILRVCRYLYQHRQYRHIGTFYQYRHNGYRQTFLVSWISAFGDIYIGKVLAKYCLDYGTKLEYIRECLDLNVFHMEDLDLNFLKEVDFGFEDFKSTNDQIHLLKNLTKISLLEHYC